ncbi:MAG: DUF3352 domain-containing protein [Anaerolineae bacterium]|nr:DUF3352 domain-containing protein [Anaerolineae bacterium]
MSKWALRRLLGLIFCLVSLGPVAAQEKVDLLTWIPADFAGYIRLQVRDNGETLTALNVATFAASFLQPQRVDFQALNDLGAVIPLADLDIEDASFAQDILPWLGSEIILAYPTLGRNLQTDDRVVLLPTRDVLQSASNFNRILDQQDILKRDTYRGHTLYLADKTTIVFTPQAVLFGPTEAVKQILDVQAGTGDRLVDQAAYRAAGGSVPQTAIASGYLAGEDVLRALSVLIDGSESALPILQNISTVLDTYRKDHSLEQLVFGNALDGIGFTLQADTLRLNSVQVTLHLYAGSYAAEPVAAEFHSAVLDMVPQNAMIVQSGTDAPGAAYDLLVTLPLANFAGQVVGAFPVTEATPPATPMLKIPDSADIEQVVGGLLRVLSQQANFDFDHDLLQHLNGSYAVALLPRPNDPLPPLNLPYDLLLLAEVDDPQAALDGATKMAQLLLGLDQLETTSIDGLEFQTVQVNGEPVLHIGTVDDQLVVATGAALQQALDARRGDDRLVSRDRWQALSRDALPQLYVDIPAVYGTFLPQFSGLQLQQIKQLGVRTQYLGDGLFQMDLMATLPSQLS